MLPPGRISKTTIFLAIFIIASASFMRQIMNFVKIYTGELGSIFFINLLIVVPVFIFLLFLLKKTPSLIKTSLISLTLIAGAVFALRMRIPAEKVHILEYGILGWLAMRDLQRPDNVLKTALLAVLFCIFVGSLDEIFQWVLPYRYFDLRDIGFNGLGGAWGVLLYILANDLTPLGGEKRTL